MPRGRPERAGTKPVHGNGANLGFEAQMFLAADKLRKNLEPSDYKHVALGLIFLKHVSNVFGKPVRMPREPLFHLGTPISERYTSGLAA